MNIIQLMKGRPHWFLAIGQNIFWLCLDKAFSFSLIKFSLLILCSSSLNTILWTSLQTGAYGRELVFQILTWYSTVWGLQFCSTYIYWFSLFRVFPIANNTALITLAFTFLMESPNGNVFCSVNRYMKFSFTSVTFTKCWNSYHPLDSTRWKFQLKFQMMKTQRRVSHDPEQAESIPDHSYSHLQLIR